jgi:prevent-host-death family protein
MYETADVDAIATITELRADTASVIEHAQKTNHGIMIQKNNQPEAVLISWEMYKRLKEEVDLQDLV